MLTRRGYARMGGGGVPRLPPCHFVTSPLCVVASSVSLVSAQGRKARSLRCSSFPHRTRLRLGFGGDPIWGLIEVRSCLPCKGRCRPNGRRRGSPGGFSRRGSPGGVPRRGHFSPNALLSALLFSTLRPVPDTITGCPVRNAPGSFRWNSS